MSFMKAACNRTLALLNKLQWAGPLLLRLTVGLVFAYTGWGKLHSLEQVTQYFESLKIPAPGFHAGFIASLEFVGGLMLMAGLATRLVSALLMGTMAVALSTAILPDLHGLRDLAASIEFTYLAIFAWFVLSGPGRVSLDAVIVKMMQRKSPELVTVA